MVLFLAVPLCAQQVETAVHVNGIISTGGGSLASCSSGFGSCNIAVVCSGGVCTGGGSSNPNFNAELAVAVSPAGGNGFTLAAHSFTENLWLWANTGLGINTWVGVSIYAKVAPSARIALSCAADFQFDWRSQISSQTLTMTNIRDLCVGIRNDNSHGQRDGSKTASWNTQRLVSPGYRIEGTDWYQVQHLQFEAGTNANGGYSDGVGQKGSFNGSFTTSFKVQGAVMNIAGGAGQAGPVKTALAEPLRVRVVDGETGTPVPGVNVGFTVSAYPAGGGDASVAGGGATDPQGYASATLTLGSAAGSYQVKAACPSCMGNREVLFTATATEAPPPKRVELRELFCDGSYFAGREVPYPLRVAVVDAETGAPAPGLEVGFALTQNPGGGELMVVSTTTDPNGVARTFLRLGSTGLHKFEATCPACAANHKVVVCPVEALEAPQGAEQVPEVPLHQRQSGQGVVVTVTHDVVAPQGTGAAVGQPEESLVTIETSSPDVNLTARILAMPNSGGHQHDGGRPTGTFAESSRGEYSGATGPDGRLALTYRSGETGGEEIIEVRTEAGQVGREFVFVRVAGLAPLGAGAFVPSGKTDGHPNNHYGKAVLLQELADLAEAYRSSFSATISINDMSLISGGVFDLGRNWTGPHDCHRIGTSLDLDRRHRKDGQFLPIRNMAQRIEGLINEVNAATPGRIDCRRIVEAKKDGKCLVHMECPALEGGRSCTQTAATCAE